MCACVFVQKKKKTSIKKIKQFFVMVLRFGVVVTLLSPLFVTAMAAIAAVDAVAAMVGYHCNSATIAAFLVVAKYSRVK